MLKHLFFLFGAVALAFVCACGDSTMPTKSVSLKPTLPQPHEFVPVERYPEMITFVQPEYPRLAMQAGIEGTVWIEALVDSHGNVRDALVAKTSGVPSLDEAARNAAYQNKFKPGILDGRPVACWVTYKVDFKLNH